ncbi:hypothetical protein B0H14DRAFT_2850539 [Mycena olivaceomarginata]|nr:hypothetical protein B0H14DRAFT_3035208 [Mycena olivaceomarginata]KAJ7814445.1 hypothetical protein B0H14DRAFT_2850539 [Mycena olivaceomarginata]
MIRYPKSTLLSVLLSMVPERRLEAQILGRVINSRLDCGDIGIVHFKFTESISDFHLSRRDSRYLISNAVIQALTF